MTVFSGTIHRDNLAAYIPLVTEMITQPRFDPEDFERLRNEAIDYVTKTLRGNNDEELGKWTLQVELYKDHPYGHPGPWDRAGPEGDHARRRQGVSSPALHARGGAVRSGGRVRRGDARPGGRPFRQASLRRTCDIPALPAPRMPKGLDVTIVEKPAEATAISMGFPIDVTRRDDDFYALAVANSYLGEHRTFNGKLMQDLRGKRGLNYGDYSYIEDFIQEGPSTFPDPQQSAPPGLFFDLDSAGTGGQVGLRPPSGPLGAGPAGRARHVPARLRDDPLVLAQLQQALGSDAVAPARAMRSTASFTAGKTWSPSWPSGYPS